MDRDRKFEVQYILSLMVVVAAVSTSQLDHIILESVGFLFLFTCSLHLLLLILYYSLEHGVEFDLPITQKARRGSKWTLHLTTMGFLYLIFHGIANSIFASNSNEITVVSAEAAQMIITSALPILPVTVIYGAFGYLIAGPLKASRDITLNIKPESLKIFQEFSDTDPVLIEILNKGEESYQLELEADLPDEVILEHEDERYADEFKYGFELDEERRPIHIQLRHNSRERKREIIRFTLNHGEKAFSEEMDVFLRV